jgi:hypothetical protein
VKGATENYPTSYLVCALFAHSLASGKGAKALNELLTGGTCVLRRRWGQVALQRGN